MTRSRQFTGDRKLLRITKSSDYALRGVRHATGSLRLWADQVCINQHDLRDRSQQVQFTGKTYERGQFVHVWLGPNKNHFAEKAFRLLCRLRESFDVPSFLSEFKDAQNKNVEQFENEDFRTLKELYDLPWFSRVWICQEIGTAIPSVLQWGQNQDYLGHALPSFQRFGPES